MPIGKLGQRRQVVIPKDICENLGLETGDFVEIVQEGGRVIIKRILFRTRKNTCAISKGKL